MSPTLLYTVRCSLSADNRLSDDEKQVTHTQARSMQAELVGRNAEKMSTSAEGSGDVLC